MSDSAGGQNLLIGVDVGGTFTDLLAWDGRSLRVAKVPSTPPDFQRGVIDAVSRAAMPDDGNVEIVHGSTVATNALLQRAVEPVAFITTEGFRDMLLIGRQNRPELYALRIERPAPVTSEENWFTVFERIDAQGDVVDPLDVAEVDRLVDRIREKGLRHVAVCLLFSFVNPAHEQIVGERCRAAGLTVTLSSDLIPEFREYERASTTAINAALRPKVANYLRGLETDLRSAASAPLRIMHSSGGTLTVEQACEQPARLLLSGPAGGVIGAAYVARVAGFENVITYDMGGTSTDVATIVGGSPRRTTSSVIDGLPVGLPMFDIHTIGAGGGASAMLDVGGALRVGPQSAGAVPGPACYGRGGVLPTVTDANLILGRIPVDAKLAGSLSLSREAADRAVVPLAREMNKSIIEAAIGITRVAESNMAHAVRAVTSRRGLDPRDFALVSFGGAGGLHACAIADELDIPRVVIPPYCGVLSALGMVVAPPVVEASKTVLHLAKSGQLDDDRLAAEYGSLSAKSIESVAYESTASVEPMADVRFTGQSHELTVRVARPSVEAIREAFVSEYRQVYGSAPANRTVEIVTLRLRRTGRAAPIRLPELAPTSASRPSDTVKITTADGRAVDAPVLDRQELRAVSSSSRVRGPALLLDPQATSFIPPGWLAESRGDGTVVLSRE